jgi:hypothetical protein
VSAIRSTAVIAIPINSGFSQLSNPDTRNSSMNMPMKTGASIAGTTSASPTRMRYATDVFSPTKRRLSAAITLGGRPARLKSGPGSNVSTTPVKHWSNSSSLTTRGPVAGSFR